MHRARGGGGCHRLGIDRHGGRARLAGLLALILGVLSLSGCGALTPQVRVEVEPDGSGNFSLETRLGGGLADLPVRGAFEVLRQQYGLAGVQGGEVTTVRRRDVERLALRLPFRSEEDLRRVTAAQVAIPEVIRIALPPPLGGLLPPTVSLADTRLQVEHGLLGSKTYRFEAVVDPILQRAIETSGASLRVALPGSITNTNGRRVDGEIAWPGPDGWPSRLEARSQVGLFGLDWGWAGLALVVLAGLGIGGGLGWFFFWRNRAGAPAGGRSPIPRRPLRT